MKQTIAILCHPGQEARLPRYVIDSFASFWREDGHDVFYLFGPDRFVPGDLVIVHVDLTVVPEAYFDLARRYPIVINGSIKDVRKSTFSRLRVRRGDTVEGRVIVKSELNFAGIPERMFGVPHVAPTAIRLRAPPDYRIYESIEAVPQAIWDDPALIVERFLPTMEDGAYVTWALNFLGDQVSCGKLVGKHPIVGGGTQIRIDRVAPHPEMVALRAELGIDFGKLDYVVHDGAPILLDVNKTVGAGHIPLTPERMTTRRRRAEGLYAYFAQER